MVFSVRDHGKSIEEKRVNFAYHQLMNIGPQVDSLADYSHILLKSIDLKTGESDLLDTYHFRYYGVETKQGSNSASQIIMPKKDSPERDHFGYYFPGDTSRLFESFLYPENPARARFTLLPVENLENHEIRFPGKKFGFDRLAISNGSIEQVTLPSGGQIRFTYEPNFYYDSLHQRDIYGGGVRVKSLITSDGHDHLKDIIFTYLYVKNGHSSGVLKNMPSYSYIINHHYDNLKDKTVYNESPYYNVIRYDRDQSGSPPYTWYSEVTKVKKGFGKTVYSYNVGKDYNDDQWTCGIARPGSQDYGSLPLNNYLLNHPPYSFHFEGQPKSTKVFDNSGNLLSETIMEYETKYYEEAGYSNKLFVLGMEMLEAADSFIVLYQYDTVVMGKLNYPSKTIKREYNRTDLSKYSETISTTGLNDQFPLPAYHKVKLNDGTILINASQYLGDLDLSALSDSILYFMDSLGMHGVEIESVLIKDSTELMSATAVKYSIENGYLLQSERYGISSRPLNAFSPFVSSLDTGYILLTKRKKPDYNGNPTVLTNELGENTCLGFDEKGNLVFQGSNILPSQIFYSGFEEDFLAPYHFYSGSRESPGFTGKYSGILGSDKSLTFKVYQPTDERYTILFDALTYGSGTLETTFSDGVSTKVDTLEVESASGWVHVDFDLGVLWLNDGDTLEITLKSIDPTNPSGSLIADFRIDNVVVLPTSAQYVLTDYDLLKRPISVLNESGLIRQIEYDKKGRPKIERDGHQNILIYNEYFEKNLNSANPEIFPKEITLNDTTSFYVSPSYHQDYSYRWKIFDPPTGANPFRVDQKSFATSTVTTIGKYAAYIDTSHSGKYLGLQVVSETDTIGYAWVYLAPEINQGVTLHVDGVRKWDLCSNKAIEEYLDMEYPAIDGKTRIVLEFPEGTDSDDYIIYSHTRVGGTSTYSEVMTSEELVLKGGDLPALMMLEFSIEPKTEATPEMGILNSFNIKLESVLSSPTCETISSQ